MKITVSQLKQMVREQIENLSLEAQNPEVIQIIRDNPSARIVYDELKSKGIPHYEIFALILKAFKK
jgi:hypothetical protein